MIGDKLPTSLTVKEVISTYSSCTHKTHLLQRIHDNCANAISRANLTERSLGTTTLAPTLNKGHLSLATNKLANVFAAAPQVQLLQSF